MSYRESGSFRTTGRAETDEGYLSPPSRGSGMNLYDAVTSHESTSGAKKSSASRQTSSNGYSSASARKTAASLPYQGQANEDVEFGTDDDMMPRKPSSRRAPSRQSPPYAARAPRASNSASLKQSDPSSSYRSSRQAHEAGARGVATSNPPQQHVRLHSSVRRTKQSFMLQEDETTLGDDLSGRGRVLEPGAFRVGGPAIEDAMIPIEDESMMTQPSDLSQNLETGQPYGDLIDADIVDPAEQERRLAERRATEKKNAPLAGIAEDKPWYKRPVILGVGVLLIIVLVVAIAVVVSTGNKGSGAGAPSPSSSPTSSPAPTALAVISLVVQLDNEPWQTGWKLVCDEETIEDARPGTYGLVTGRPNFRVEREFTVTLGAECQLSLLDSEGNGLNPGLFEIYNGDNIGDRSALIDSGSVSGNNATFLFTVGASDGGSPPDPSSPPTAALAAANNTATCTVCPDGQPVLFPEAATVGAVTCAQLESLAMSITNDTECEKIRNESATQCGCRNHCTTICPDGVSGPNVSNYDSVVFVKNDRTVTCAEFQDQVTSSFSNSVEECLSANFLGEDVCGCEPTEAFCRICEPVGNSSSTNPPAEDLGYEIVPGVSCRDITGIAYTLKKDDPSGIFQELCPACLAIGAYCGCGIPEDGRKFCRLCGASADILPEPSRMVDSSLLGYNTTCYHIEFMSNIVSDKTLPCSVYREDASHVCCSKTEP